jgi:hypothetical protein
VSCTEAPIEGFGPGTPDVVLITARPATGPSGLQAWARRLSQGQGAACTSRSYRYPYALVAWHDEPVGADIERVGPCQSGFAELICTPEERDRWAGSVATDRDLTSLWSAKEALAKALGDAVNYEPSRLGSPSAWPDGRAGPWRAVELVAPSGYVAWLCWRTSGSSAALGPQEVPRGRAS